MTRAQYRFGIGFVLLASASAGFAQAPAGASAASSSTTRPAVVVIGASVSGGFSNLITATRESPNKTRALAYVLKKVWPRKQVALVNKADVMLYLNPPKLGAKQVRDALVHDPSLVIAMDFAFWFGCGRGNREVRLARQQRCFEMLNKLSCPILLGDYPDMTGADPRICPPSLIPDQDTQAELNKRLHDYAKSRANVHVFPLRQWVAKAKAGKFEMAYDGKTIRVPTEVMMQNDRLHATTLGVTLLGHRVLEQVQQMLGAEHPLCALLGPADAPPLVDRLIQKMRVAKDLESAPVVKPAAAPKKPQLQPAGGGDR